MRRACWALIGGDPDTGSCIDCVDEMQLRQLMMSTAEAAFSETEAAAMLACVATSLCCSFARPLTKRQACWIGKIVTFCFASLVRWATDPDDKGIFLEDMSRRLALDGKTL